MLNLSCDIIIPTYNRNKFKKLIENNINSQDYPFINKIIIGDDGDETLKIDTKYKVEYHKMNRCSIGYKRNFLISNSTSSYVCMMDTDDYYYPSYISKSIFNLLYHDKKISGSSDMVILDNVNKKSYLQRCIYSHLLNEATLIYKRDFVDKFNDSSSGEGREMFIDCINHIHHTDINNIMLCIAHGNNTVNKECWFKPEYEITTDENIIKILCDCNV